MQFTNVLRKRPAQRQDLMTVLAQAFKAWQIDVFDKRHKT
jgi:hypothetical protein